MTRITIANQSYDLDTYEDYYYDCHVYYTC